jgi:integrase
MSSEIEIIREDQIQIVLRKLRGRSIYMIAALALSTGMRRGELLGLRWQDIDLNSGTLRVVQSLEQTKAGLRFKAPKTKHGRRTITLPPSIAAELRMHWKQQQEQRLALGLGKAPETALVFPTWDGKPRSPGALTKEWTRAMKGADMKVTLHALRHTHASSLIAAGVDVLTISRRLGHASPTITLGVYGHLYSNTDDRAAQIMEAMHVTKQFTRKAAKLGFPGLRLHDLRGSHETLLLDANVPVHVVAARCGHDPAVLLRSYAKRTRKNDASAAEVIGALSRGVLKT